MRPLPREGRGPSFCWGGRYQCPSSVCEPCGCDCLFVWIFVARRGARSARQAQRDVGNQLWATVQHPDGRIVGLAMHIPPHPVFLSRMPDGAGALLARAIGQTGRRLPGVNGALGPTAAFAGAWQAGTGQASKVVTAMRMYRLGELVRPLGVPGGPSPATAPGDVALVAAWLGSFHDEVHPDAPVEDWRVMAERRIATGQVHLWRAGGVPVALAAVSAPAAGVARVWHVYTAVGARRRGYGSAITAHVTAAALAGGAKHVVLYTDLANPTSNRIYQAIGYRPHHDAEERTFIDPPPDGVPSPQRQPLGGGHREAKGSSG